MKPAVRNALIGLGACGAVAVAALPWFSSRALDKQLADMAAKPSGQSDIILRNLQHKAGYLSSSGTVDVVLRDRCHESDAGGNTTFRVSYEAHHFPTPTAATRFDWKLTPTGDASAAFAKVFGTDSPLSGQGAVSWRGMVQSEMRLPAISYGSEGSRFETEPSQGRIAANDKALQFNWNLDRAVLRGHGRALELKQLSIDMDLQDRHRGIGDMALRIATFGTQDASGEGFELKSVASEHDGRIDSTFTQSLKRVQFADQNLQDLVLEASLKGLHAASVETLTTVLSNSCGMDTLTRDESTRVRDAIKTLLSSGMTAGINKLSGKGQGGAIEGQWSLALAPVQTGQSVSLEEQVSSEGQVLVKGQVLNAAQKEMLVASGFAVTTPEGIQSSFKYGKGTLTINGKPRDGSGIQHMFASLDEKLMMVLQGKVDTQVADNEPEQEVAADEPAEAAPADAAAPAAPPSDEAQPPAQPAPAPAPAPVSNACTDVASCARQTLLAATREDLDAIRQAATRIDGFNKPDLGNKAQARKLNNDALAALQQGDAQQAVTLLQNAQRENPRDIEVASNLGYALIKAQRPKEAVAVLTNALLLDPRRTSTWAPLGEAYAHLGQSADAAAALWTAWQWSGNRDRTLSAYMDKVQREAATRPPLAEAYQTTVLWIRDGQRPRFTK